MADVTGAFIAGHQAGQQVAEHQQALEDNKLRRMVLQHQLSQLKVEDALRNRDIAIQNASFLEGRPAADLPQQPIGEGDTSGTNIPAVAPGVVPQQTKVAPVNIPGVSVPELGIDQPGTSITPRSAEQIFAQQLRQKMAENAMTPYTLTAPEGGTSTRYENGVQVASVSGGPKPKPLDEALNDAFAAGDTQKADTILKTMQAAANARRDPEALAQVQALRAMQLELDRQRLAQGNGQAVEVKEGSPEYKVAQDMAYGKLTMQQFRALYSYSRNIGAKLGIYQKAAELNPNFNPAQFEMGFKLASDPQTQKQLASMDNVNMAVPDLLKFSDAASRSGVTALNRLVNKGGYEIGGKHYSDFRAAQKAFADELSGALGYGTASDMKLALGVDITDPAMSPANFQSAIQNVIVPFVDRKRASLLGQMGVYGQPGMNPGADRAATQAQGTPSAPNVIRYDMTGKPIH